LRKNTNTILVAISKKKKQERAKGIKWEVFPNPADSVPVNAGDIVILLGNNEQFKKAREFLGTAQGR
jgi:K+/H+ antiporter YhaU regulatory subunit KhtT